MRLAFGIFTVLISIAAKAGENCYHRNLIDDVSETQAEILKIAVYGEPDRKTAEEYAADPAHLQPVEQLKRKYSATGDFNCGGLLSQANLTVKDDVLVTTAHSIYGEHPTTCKPIAALESCKFTVELEAGKTQTISIGDVIRSGNGCPQGPPNFKSNQDWIVLKLKSPVDSSVAPYKVSSVPLKKGDPIVAVGKSIDFVRKDASGKKTYPRHYADCTAIDIFDYDTRNIGVGMDCDAAGYSSGGGRFRPGPGPPVLVAIQEGGKAELIPENKRPKSGPYSSTWMAGGVAIDGDLLETLQKINPDGVVKDGTEI